ncbi:hypothetical protein NQ318_013452 [Aromia moschata]|uniref:Gem-associated protein 8 n=1 Tax=Aromia moschata TaxID=1265417 RepID=A0AAV8YP73_9CUCU|nr:hypothetical protein NQ318_013452 [Aromia moschata]
MTNNWQHRANMADNEEDVAKVSNTNKSFKKRSSLKKFRFPPKSSLRRFRRKRSKTRYYKSLKQLRCTRKTQELCTAVEGFDIYDMDWAPTSSSAPVPPEITEWQKQEQIAYWKSRAIGLELENRMLHEHLRNVYAKTIEDQLQYRECFQGSNDNAKNNDQETIEDEQSVYRKSQVKKKKVADRDENAAVKRPVSPREPEGKNRLEMMKKIYGDEASKIMGMETALQLNYERIKNQLKPPHWPTIPLRLSFD